jgi:Cof subfamily protein (haloacid dehalogenase superfamily)
VKGDASSPSAMVSSEIKLVLADVDGTLVTSAKELTSQTIAAVHQLNEAGIAFAVTSGRPPRGLTMLVDPLRITTPLAGFNGGMVVDAEMRVLEEKVLPAELVAPIIDVLSNAGLSVWVFQGIEWYVLDEKGPHVAREMIACQFAPLRVSSFSNITKDVAKIVGISDDPEQIANASAAMAEAFGDQVAASSSQTYYLDVTNIAANKGSVIDYLSRTLKIETEYIATIGDMENDVAMFEKSGLSIAMGNASSKVRGVATVTTLSNDADGFANAMRNFILAPRQF